MLAMLITYAHLWALGQIESGGNSVAVSETGAVTQYQISALVWKKRFHGQDPHDPKVALRAAQTIWQERVNHFVKTHQRQPTLEELALLWHVPKRLAHPRKSEQDYALRFKNLFSKYKIP